MKKLIAYLGLGLFMGSMFFNIASANTFEFENRIIKDAQTEGDLYLMGGEVVVDKEVKGDLFVMGNLVTINAPVHGDLMAVGSNVVLNAKVADDARISGANISLNNTIGSDLVIPAAGTVNFSEKSLVVGEMVVNAGLLNFAGEVKQNLRALLLNLNFKGKVGGDANMFVDRQLLIDDKSVIAGDLKYFALQKAKFSRGVVKGAVKFNNTVGVSGIWDELTSQFATGRLLFTLASFLGILLVTLVLVLISPKHLIKSAAEIETAPIKCFSYGFVGAVAFVVLGFVLMLTVVGVPLGLIFFVITALFLYLGRVLFAMWLGQKIIPLKANASKSKTFGAVTLGLLIYYLVGMLPVYVGFISSMLFSFTGFGAFLLSRIMYFRFLQKNKMA